MYEMGGVCYKHRTDNKMHKKYSVPDVHLEDTTNSNLDINGRIILNLIETKQIYGSK
jgi:hypothetical protein